MYARSIAELCFVDLPIVLGAMAAHGMASVAAGAGYAWGAFCCFCQDSDMQAECNSVERGAAERCRD